MPFNNSINKSVLMSCFLVLLSCVHWIGKQKNQRSWSREIKPTNTGETAKNFAIRIHWHGTETNLIIISLVCAMYCTMLVYLQFFFFATFERAVVTHKLWTVYYFFFILLLLYLYTLNDSTNEHSYIYSITSNSRNSSKTIIHTLC